jgi:RNA 3'-terminal phosphate cyclase (ATP)
MLLLDGSEGEGGGQVLRTALSLSLVTGQPFRIHSIRQRRDKPGLMRQHLTAVQAAAELGNATVRGDAVGSQDLTFTPGSLRSGEFRFTVGTAGSTTLVLQTLLPALLAAPAATTVVLEGGTHNPFAPPFDFLQRAFLPQLQRMGGVVELRLERAGFHPAGGGRVLAQVEPGSLRPLELLQRGAARPIRARALSSKLPAHVGEREVRVLCQRLGLPESRARSEDVASYGPGNVVLVELPFEHVTEVTTGFGKRGLPAEEVAAAAADDALAYLASDAPVAVHLADQLLLPRSLARGGVFRTSAPSLHTRTNALVIERFLPVQIGLRPEGDASGTWLVSVTPR